MPYTDNKCKACSNFDRYYTVLAGKLYRLDYGLCKLTGDRVQDCSGTCQKWKSASKKRAREKTLCVALLETMCADLCVIKEILSDGGK